MLILNFLLAQSVYFLVPIMYFVRAHLVPILDRSVSKANQVKPMQRLELYLVTIFHLISYAMPHISHQKPPLFIIRVMYTYPTLCWAWGVYCIFLSWYSAYKNRVYTALLTGPLQSDSIFLWKIAEPRNTLTKQIHIQQVSIHAH